MRVLCGERKVRERGADITIEFALFCFVFLVDCPLTAEASFVTLSAGTLNHGERYRAERAARQIRQPDPRSSRVV